MSYGQPLKKHHYRKYILRSSLQPWEIMPHYGVQSLWLKTYWSEKVIKPEKDAYGQELLAFLQGEEVYEIIEREDHFIDASPHGPAVYFSEFPDWPQIEQEAIQYAHGRVLDVGCGAGRVCLYLQEKATRSWR